MITVGFTFTEALQFLYDRRNDKERHIIGIATNDLLRRHQFISFANGSKYNCLRTMTVHSDKCIKPSLEYTVTTDDFNNTWMLYYTREDIVADINKLSDVKVETE